MNTDDVWKDDQVLIPAIIQDSNTKSVLMLGYMNKESYQKTIDINKVTFYSRSCLLYTSPSPRDLSTSRMPSSA